MPSPKWLVAALVMISLHGGKSTLQAQPSRAIGTYYGPQATQMAQLQEENMRLKQLVAELTLNKTMLQDVLSKKW